MLAGRKDEAGWEEVQRVTISGRKLLDGSESLRGQRRSGRK